MLSSNSTRPLGWTIKWQSITLQELNVIIVSRYSLLNLNSQEMDHARRDIIQTLKFDPKHAHAQSFMAMLGTCIPLHDLEPFPSQRLLRRIPNPEEMTTNFRKLDLDLGSLDTNDEAFEEPDTLPLLPNASPKFSKTKMESVSGNAARLVSRGTSRQSVQKDVSRPVSAVPKS